MSTGTGVRCDDSCGPFKGWDRYVADARRILGVIVMELEWEWWLDSCGVFTYSSHAGFDLVGYRAAELIGRPVTVVMDIAALTCATASTGAAVGDDSNGPGLVIAARHRDGANVCTEVDGHAVHDPNGRLIGFRGTSRLSSSAANAIITDRITSRIRNVLVNQLLVTAFQPIVALESGRVIGVEALTRFVAEPLVEPEVWFGDAAAVGLGTDLELFAIRTALTAATSLPDHLSISVNACPSTCLDPRLATMISRSTIDTRRIVLEITEHAPVADYHLLATALADLRHRGMRLAVDDAGSGFASFQHVLQLSPDVIKLDRGVINGIDIDPARRALARAVVWFAEQVGTQVVAEGIETPAELAAIMDAGVSFAQGFLLGRASVIPREWAGWESGSAGLVDRNRVAPPPNLSGDASAVAVLDALPDATAVLGHSGVIVAVNHAWRMFAVDNGGNPESTGVGVNYLDVCARAAAGGSADAEQVLVGLRAVLGGGAVEGEWEYPCDSPSVKRWFISRITSIGAPLGGAVTSHVNITRRKALEQELAHQAFHDPLTGLANRELFARKVSDVLSDRRDRMPGERVGLWYIDLDDFKPVNDQYGHAAGDEVLLEVAQRLRSCLRPQDTLARLGGDEFAICTGKMTPARVAALSQRLFTALAVPHHVHGHQVRVGGSIGSYLAEPGVTVADALHAADQAMYVVKNARTDRIAVR